MTDLMKARTFGPGFAPDRLVVDLDTSATTLGASRRLGLTGPLLKIVPRQDLDVFLVSTGHRGAAHRVGAADGASRTALDLGLLPGRGRDEMAHGARGRRRRLQAHLPVDQTGREAAVLR